MNNSPDSSQVLSTSPSKLYSTSHAPQILKSSSYHSQLLSGSRHALSLQSSGSIVSLENSSIKSDNPAWGDSTALAESLSQKKKEADIIRRKCIAIETKLENEKQKIKFLEEEISEISKKRNEKISGKRENDPRVSEINKEKEKKDKEIGKLKEVVDRIEKEEGKIKGQIQKLQGEWNKYKVKSGEENKKIQEEIDAIDEILGKKKSFDEKEIENDHRVKKAKDEMEKIAKDIYEIKRKTERKDEEEKELLRSIGEIKMRNEMLLNRLREREIEKQNKEKELLNERTLQINDENNGTQGFGVNEKSSNNFISEEFIHIHDEVKQVHPEAPEEVNNWQIDFEPPIDIDIEIPIQAKIDFEPPIETNQETLVQVKEEVHIEILKTITHEAISKEIVDIETHKQPENSSKVNGLSNGYHKETPKIQPTLDKNIELILDENVWGIDEDLQAVTEICEKSEIPPSIHNHFESKQDFIESDSIINSFENKDTEKIEFLIPALNAIDINSQKSQETKINESEKIENNIESQTPNGEKSIEEKVEISQHKDIIENHTEKVEIKTTEAIKEEKKSEPEIQSSQNPIEEIKAEAPKQETSSSSKPKPLFANKSKFAAPPRKIPTQKKIADVNFDPDDFFQEMSKKNPQKQFK